MTLIVEDGTNVAGAESYASVAVATAYHANMGNAAWAAVVSDTVREQLLRKATAYMLQTYRFRWAGYRRHDDQALDWPRIDVPKRDGAFRLNYYDVDIVPTEVKNACAELALRAISGDLLGDLSQAKTKVTVGPISTEYSQASPQVKRFTSVDAMLAPFFSRPASAAQVVRS